MGGAGPARRAIAAAVTLEAGARGLLARRAPPPADGEEARARELIGQSVQHHPVLCARPERAAAAHRLRRAVASTRIAAYARRRLARVRFPIPAHGRACRARAGVRAHAAARGVDPSARAGRSRGARRRAQRRPPEVPPPRARGLAPSSRTLAACSRPRATAARSRRSVASSPDGGGRASAQAPQGGRRRAGACDAHPADRARGARPRANAIRAAAREAREKLPPRRSGKGRPRIKSQNAADDSLLRLGIVRRDPSALSNDAIRPHGRVRRPPDVHALYAASAPRSRRRAAARCPRARRWPPGARRTRPARARRAARRGRGEDRGQPVAAVRPLERFAPDPSLASCSARARTRASRRSGATRDNGATLTCSHGCPAPPRGPTCNQRAIAESGRARGRESSRSIEMHAYDRHISLVPIYAIQVSACGARARRSVKS